MELRRPGLRPMRALPLLEPRRTALETCVFCPKLCRSACPVSNAEPRETLTPWGKMSLSWMVAQGDVPLDRAHAAPAWACTGCFACREWCDHKNPVGPVLLDARDAMVRRGLAPEGAHRTLRGFARHDRRTRAAARILARHPSARADAETALLVGCVYMRGAPAEARQAVDAAAALSGGPVAVAEGCCGLPLRLAGDQASFAAAARATARALSGRSRVLVLDPGCARTLRRDYPDVGAALGDRVELLVEVAARRLSGLAPLAGAVDARGPVRWHDPCQLGRGLGLYDAPRTVLARLLGRPPEEFDERREQATCSGGGGLLPATMPDVAGAIALGRLSEHRRLGGGRVVTACGSSLLSLRRRGRAEGVAVDDLVTWIARGCRGELPPR